jgi:hypothetical protein
MVARSILIADLLGIHTLQYILRNEQFILQVDKPGRMGHIRGVPMALFPRLQSFSFRFGFMTQEWQVRMEKY